MTSRALLYCAGGGIGDSLMASVVARALHERFASVDALTLPGHRGVLERVPEIDAVLLDEGGDEAELAQRLAERTYDACVVTWATARTASVPHRAKIPVRVGQARRLYSSKFTHRVTVRSELGDVVTPWPQILLDYARALDCDSNALAPSFVPTPEDEREADALLRRLDVNDFVILHPTNAQAVKGTPWPTQAWAQLAGALSDQFSTHVFVSGTGGDVPINAQIVGHASRAKVVDIAGAIGIGGFGALAQRARAFVGITTGTMHVAAAVGAPTIGIFPFQSDVPDRWGPRGAHTATVRATYRCHLGDTKETCPDFACIANLNVPRIISAVESLLRAANPG